MKLTSDQLRAARVLLHLRQDQLAKIATVGVATVRRFEGGKGIGRLHLDALRKAVEEAGAILLDADDGPNGTSRGLGVRLLALDDLPGPTRSRIEGIPSHVDEPDPAASAVSRAARIDAAVPDVPPSRRRGRPRRSSA